MPFIKEIKCLNSLSIVGMAKNTGKTTCLNYVLKRLKEEQCNVAVTSIGLDGEDRDVLYDTPKPPVNLQKGNYFITTEKHFLERKVAAKLLKTGDRDTALGPLITAQAESEGQVIISGPAETHWMQEVIDEMQQQYNVDLTIVDGALSRMSLASPAITDAMILCTGAACSPQLDVLIKRTKFLHQIIHLEQANANICNAFEGIKEGVWQINDDGTVGQKVGASLFTANLNSKEWLEIKHFFVFGALTEKFLKLLTTERDLSGICIVIRDFSRMFATPATFDKFIRRGGKIKVLHKAKLLCVCTNPTSPEGYHYDPEMLRSKMEEALKLPVFDIYLTETVKRKA